MGNITVFPEYAGHSEEERLAMRMAPEGALGGAPEEVEPPAPTPEATPEPTPEPTPVSYAEARRVQELEARNEALRQQMEDVVAYLRQQQAQGQQQAQYAQQEQPPEVPDYLDDPTAFVQHAIRQETAPLVNTIRQLMAEREQMQQMQALENARRVHGDEIAQSIPLLDQQAPHLAGLDPVVKGYILKGYQASQPAAAQNQEAQMQALIEQRAQQLLEQRLRAGAPSGAPGALPATLGGAVRGQDPIMGVDGLKLSQYGKLTDEQRLKLRTGQ